MQGRLEHEIKLNEYINKKLDGAPNYVREWNTKLMASNKTAATRKIFICRIIQFISFINERTGSDDIKNIDENILEEYLILNQTKIDNKGNKCYTSDSHKQCVWSCLNNFTKFLYSKKYIDSNYMENISKPKNNDLNRINEHRVLLTKKDFTKIIKAIDIPENLNEFPYAKRDLAIMLLFMKTGMRETALTEINVDDIDFDNERIHIIDKGNKTHTYNMDNSLHKALEEWNYYRFKYANDNDAMFINEKGNRISQNGVSFLVKKYTKNALGKELSPHKLRAGFCSILYKETGDAELVRRAVGHANVSTTQRYINTGGEEKKRACDIMSFI